MWLLSLVLYIDLHMLNQPCIPGLKPIWLWWITFLMCCCNWFASILLKIFASMFIMDISLKFSFLLSLCRVLVSGWCWFHKMIWEGFPLFGLFGIVSEGIVTVPLRVSGVIRLWTHLDLGFFLCGRLLIAASTSDLVIGLFIVSTSSWIRLGRMQVSRNLSISSRFTSLCA